MAKKKGRHRKGGRVTPKGTRPAGFTPRHDHGRDHDSFGWGLPGPDVPEPDLMQQVRTALADPHPIELLALASSIMSALDPRSDDPFERARGDAPDEVRRQQVLDAFVGSDRVETAALLAAFAELSPDELERRRLRRALDGRVHRLPGWLDRIGEAAPELEGVVENVAVLGDGDNIIIGVRFATGEGLTAVVYIDHNMGTVVKDAFVVPEPLGTVVAQMAPLLPPELSVRPLAPADAKARIVDAVEHGARVYPPIETETWPICRPLVEWMARLLPDGGRGYERPVWSDADRDALAERFFASDAGVRLDDDHHRSLLDTLLWFGCDYGPGDPMRWSPVSVEIVLTDWVPRKVVADVEYLAELPALLRAFVRFCHAERSIPAHLTVDTLAAIDEWEPVYQDAIRSDRPQGPAAILARTGAFDHLQDGGDDRDGRFDDPDHPLAFTATVMLEHLARDVGGDAALDALDTASLPDEPFDWSGIDDDVHERTAEALGYIDRFCDEVLDVEHRTACRRVLARVARLGPEVFRRRGRTDTAAAAVCWAVCQANGTFDSYGRGLKVGEMADWFDTTSSSLSSRASTLLKAGRFERSVYGYGLGSPDYLVSRTRRSLVERRDHWRSELPRDI